MIKVSVILTTFNSEKKIQFVLDSIINQDGKEELFNIELLVVDDCSTDKTCNILLNNNINFISNKYNTGGPNFGRNIALKNISGDFIIIADHDDIWMPNRLKELVSVSHLAPIISSGFKIYNESIGKNTVRVNSVMNQDYILFGKNETFISKLRKSKKGQQTYLGSLMFSSKFKDILFEEEFGMIDFDWVLKLFHNQNSIELCKPLYIRNISLDNLSLNEKYRKIDYNYSLSTINNYMANYSKDVRLSQRRINGSMGRYYYLIGNMSYARKYFLKSSFNIKTLLYIITTFAGSRLVKRYFNIFG